MYVVTCGWLQGYHLIPDNSKTINCHFTFGSWKEVKKHVFNFLDFHIYFGVD